MGIRVNRLLSELNRGLKTLDDWLKALGYKEEILSINTKIPDSGTGTCFTNNRSQQ